MTTQPEHDRMTDDRQTERWTYRWQLHVFKISLQLHVTLVMLKRIYFAFANSADPDQLASDDLDLHLLPLSMWIYINKLDQVIWLAENYKWVWHLNLFSMIRVKVSSISALKFLRYIQKHLWINTNRTKVINFCRNNITRVIFFFHFKLHLSRQHLEISVYYF